MGNDRDEEFLKLKNWRVLQVSTGAIGGAGLAARRLNQELNSVGVSSTLISLSSDSFVPDEYELEFKRSFVSRLRGAVTTKINHFFSNLVFFTLFNRNVFAVSDVYKLGKPDSTIIHLHNNYNFVDVKFIGLLAKLGYKVVVTMHDQRVMTGGCHYALECSGYLKSCGKCPRVLWPLKNLPKKNLMESERIFRLAGKNITFIAPSMWIYNEAKTSSILKKMTIVFIPNTLGNEFSNYCTKLHAKNRGGYEIVLGIASMNSKSYVKGGDLVSNTMSLLKEKEVKVKFLFLNELPNDEQSKVQNFWSQIDYLLVLSRAENSANVIHEAKFFAVPIIASMVGGTTELLHENFDIGINLKDLNPEYIVTTILNILNGKILTSGKSEMLKEFNNYVGLSITKHIDLYKRIME